MVDGQKIYDKHRAERGEKAGQWVPCSARIQCRLQTIHVNDTVLEEANFFYQEVTGKTFTNIKTLPLKVVEVYTKTDTATKERVQKKLARTQIQGQKKFTPQQTTSHTLHGYIPKPKPKPTITVPQAPTAFVFPTPQQPPKQVPVFPQKPFKTQTITVLNENHFDTLKTTLNKLNETFNATPFTPNPAQYEQALTIYKEFATKTATLNPTRKQKLHKAVEEYMLACYAKQATKHHREDLIIATPAQLARTLLFTETLTTHPEQLDQLLTSR